MHAVLMAMARPAVRITGELGATGATSTVTGTARTVTVPAGNSGVATVTEQAINSGGNLEHSINGGGFVVPTGGTITFADSDTVQFRVTGMASLDGIIVDLDDQSSGRPVVTFTISRT